VNENREILSHLLIAIQGVPDHDILGKPTGTYVGGMENDIREFRDQANGGKGFSIRNRDKLIIGAIAAVPAIASLIIALVALSQYGGSP